MYIMMSPIHEASQGTRVVAYDRLGVFSSPRFWSGPREKGGCGVRVVRGRADIAATYRRSLCVA